MKIFLAIVGVIALFVLMAFLMYDPAIEETPVQAVVTGKYPHAVSNGDVVHVLYYLRMKSPGDEFDLDVNLEDYDRANVGDHFTVKKVRHKSGNISYRW